MSNLALTYKEYWDEIRAIADSAFKHEDSSERNEDVDYHMSEHEFLIYTGKALAVLVISSNESAYFDEFGKLEADNFHDMVSTLAEAAMRQDIYERLAHLQEEKDES